MRRERSTSSPIGYHVIMRLDDSRVIAETVVALRAVAAILHARGARCQLLAFSVVDTHIHALLVCYRVAAGQFAHDVEVACVMKLRLVSRFEPARIRPVRDQHHLANTFWYVLRQAAHHGVTSDPLHEGSSLSDLLGLRVLGNSLKAIVRSKLPRVSTEPLERAFGISLLPQPFDLGLLAEAAAAALALPHLGVAGRPAQRARAAAVVVAGAHVDTAELARALGVSQRTVARHRRRKVAAELRNAVTLQLAARSALKLSRLADEEALAALAEPRAHVDSQGSGAAPIRGVVIASPGRVVAPPPGAAPIRGVVIASPGRVVAPPSPTPAEHPPRRRRRPAPRQFEG